jgi:hypothetical protein
VDASRYSHFGKIQHEEGVMDALTLVHVALSLAGILAGLVALFGLIGGKRMDGWTAAFLITTIATSVTGFFFPFHGITPGIVVGVLSVIVLAVAVVARYQRHMAGAWRKTYVITSALALYFNVFVLVVQLFQKVTALKELAPTQSEPPFAIAQVVVMAVFVALTILAVRNFRTEQPQARARAAAV